MTSDREYWGEVLAAGGHTAIPRWTRDPAPGVAVVEAAIQDDLVVALGRLADNESVPRRSLVLAAHAAVLAAVCGEHHVVTGYRVTPGSPPLPLHLSTRPETWRGLLNRTGRAESALRAHAGVRLDDLRREMQGPSFETVFDPTDDRLADDTVLQVGIAWPGGRPTLRLRYRTEALDGDAAARIAGYHLTALALMTADPDAEHRRQSLLSAEELRLQRDELAGPHRELPDRRAHELFEQRAAEHPDAVAAVHGDRSLTYRELNARANRIGRALLARGLRREGVVAVVTGRDLDWAAAVLGILKAGGVYLPVEPHFPADRIAAMLSRAGCSLVLTAPGCTDTLDRAVGPLPGVATVLVDELCTEADDDADLGVVVEPDRLAYIYFTSGSTGEPKGAMCEHAGMLNHLYAKIDDLGIGPDRVVAQTAPQCFDISLWQLLSALLVGGRTLLVEQEAVLDVARFVDTVVDGRVGVLQVVPSYLDAVLSHLEQSPRELPDLRCVSVTGEALKVELAERWFATAPGIPLVNAYGLTETSDDTNHAIMRRAPERVLVGPPVANVRVAVVDEHLAPVPLGAPGEIVFSGVCVGRGYVNDPERTRHAFVEDPDGRRIYRSGDRGRWWPGGGLEFLGRRDNQVKISGFRIEIGEIEDALARVPGVRDGAVAVVERSDGVRHLAAFYSGRGPLAVDVLRDRLAGSLPGYMVPTAFHWTERLPLTRNGKIDRTSLAALAGELAIADHQAPRTQAERRVAHAWAGVLGVGVDEIGRHDHFFDRGGTSLAAVKLVIALDRAVTLADVIRLPVLAELARLVEPTGPMTRPNGDHDVTDVAARRATSAGQAADPADRGRG